MHWPGIEPRPPAWQARILPLNHQCFTCNLLHYRICCATVEVACWASKQAIFQSTSRGSRFVYQAKVLFCLKLLSPVKYHVGICRWIHWFKNFLSLLLFYDFNWRASGQWPWLMHSWFVILILVYMLFSFFAVCLNDSVLGEEEL